MGRVLRRHARIVGATALELKVPSSRAAITKQQPKNTVFQLEAVFKDRKILGIGEASPRGRRLTGDTATGSWRFLNEALERLERITIRRRPAHARADIVAILEEFRDLAVRLSSRRGESPPYRATIAGLEMALLDLAAKVVNQPVARFLGGDRRPLPGALPLSPPQLGKNRHKRLLSSGRYAVVKVIDIGSSDEAIDSAAQVAAMAGTSKPIWLELSEPLPASESHHLVSELAKKITADDLPRHMVLQLNQPYKHPALADLQAAADEAVAPSIEEPGIVIMADIASVDMMRAVGRVGVRGVNLNPQRLGGMLAVLETA